jgi:hypothetical protein
VTVKTTVLRLLALLILSSPFVFAIDNLKLNSKLDWEE